MFIYKSSSRSSTEWISSAELCTLSCACLQAGGASQCGLKELDLPHCVTMAHVELSPVFLPLQGWGFSRYKGGLSRPRI